MTDDMLQCKVSQLDCLEWHYDRVPILMSCIIPHGYGGNLSIIAHPQPSPSLLITAQQGSAPLLTHHPAQTAPLVTPQLPAMPPAAPWIVLAPMGDQSVSVTTHCT